MSTQRLSITLQSRVTPAEAERTAALAERAGMTVSEYIRACLMQDAVASLDKGAIAQLTKDVTQRVLASLKVKAVG